MNIIAHTWVDSKLMHIITLFYIIPSRWNQNKILFDKVNIECLIYYTSLLYYQFIPPKNINIIIINLISY